MSESCENSQRWLLRMHFFPSAASLSQYILTRLSFLESKENSAIIPLSYIDKIITKSLTK